MSTCGKNRQEQEASIKTDEEEEAESSSSSPSTVSGQRCSYPRSNKLSVLSFTREDQDQEQEPQRRNASYYNCASPVPSITPLRTGVGWDHHDSRSASTRQPSSVTTALSCADKQAETLLPTAKFLATFFLTADPLLSFAGDEDSADNNPRRHDSSYGRGITSKTSEEEIDELQLHPYAGHCKRKTTSTTTTTTTNTTTSSSSSITSAVAVPPSMEALVTSFLAPQEEHKQFNSYPPLKNVATSAKYVHSLFSNLPKSNHLSGHHRSCFFHNSAASSSIIPCAGEKILLGKQEPQQPQQNQHPQYHQQTVFSRNTHTTPNDKNALQEDDIACLITPNLRRERVTDFTYAVMCQFVKATFHETDRKGNRTKTPLGYVGLKCKYCGGEGMRTGRHFPSSLKTFTDTGKTLLPMYCHLILCHKCPGDMKSLVSRLHNCHEIELKVLKGKKLHGGQMPFYRQIWTSLRADASSKKVHRQRSHHGGKKERKGSTTEEAFSPAVAETLEASPSTS